MQRNILIAGGTSGIGRETTNRLASEACQITCACRSPQSLEGLENISAYRFDATDPNISIELPEKLDGLVYFPGTINLKPFHRLTDEDFLNDIQVNLLGAVRLLRHALPALKKGDSPSVVLFSTVAVQTGLPFHASVAAAKGAVEGLVRSLAAELAPTIRVNGIAPSLTDTPLAGSLLSTDEKRRGSADRHPLKRIGDPSETAQLVEILLGPATGFMTGQILKMDGGMSSIRLL
jgi:NAD(P)-dependent dehydrogenase (short-subunit alcohol dehydrogenase family)